jgi:anaerobic selenocysteine-containing dehydrogenase
MAIWLKGANIATYPEVKLMSENTNFEPKSKLQPTACVLCSMNCGLQVNVERNQVVAVHKDEENPITQGHICNKAFSII